MAKGKRGSAYMGLLARHEVALARIKELELALEQAGAGASGVAPVPVLGSDPCEGDGGRDGAGLPGAEVGAKTGTVERSPASIDTPSPSPSPFLPVGTKLPDWSP